MKASYPNIGTMPSRTLAMLLQGNRITHRDFWLHAGTYRLSDPIFQLRERGWDIRDTQETVPTSDPTKRSAHIKRYHLLQDVINAAGEDGRDYVRSVKEWEKQRAKGMAGAGESAPAVKAAGIHGKETDQGKDSTGVAL